MMMLAYRDAPYDWMDHVGRVVGAAVGSFFLVFIVALLLDAARQVLTKRERPEEAVLIIIFTPLWVLLAAWIASS